MNQVYKIWKLEIHLNSQHLDIKHFFFSNFLPVLLIDAMNEKLDKFVLLQVNKSDSVVVSRIMRIFESVTHEINHQLRPFADWYFGKKEYSRLSKKSFNLYEWMRKLLSTYITSRFHYKLNHSYKIRRVYEQFYELPPFISSRRRMRSCV